MAKIHSIFRPLTSTCYRLEYCCQIACMVFEAFTPPQTTTWHSKNEQYSGQPNKNIIYQIVECYLGVCETRRKTKNVKLADGIGVGSIIIWAVNPSYKQIVAGDCIRGQGLGVGVK